MTAPTTRVITEKDRPMGVEVRWPIRACIHPGHPLGINDMYDVAGALRDIGIRNPVMFDRLIIQVYLAIPAHYWGILYRNACFALDHKGERAPLFNWRKGAPETFLRLCDFESEGRTKTRPYMDSLEVPKFGAVGGITSAAQQSLRWPEKDDEGEAVELPQGVLRAGIYLEPGDSLWLEYGWREGQLEELDDFNTGPSTQLIFCATLTGAVCVNG